MTVKFPFSPDNSHPAGADDRFPDGAFGRFYELYREPFVRFARYLGCREREDALDLYNDSFLALYENIRSGRLTQLKCSLKTYLFAIGRNKIMRSHRYGGTVPLDDVLGRVIDDIAADEPGMDELYSELAARAVDGLKEPCGTVLRLFFWEGLPMEEIARRMKYRNGQVAKNRKYLCMGKLQDTFKKLLRYHGLDQ